MSLLKDLETNYKDRDNAKTNPFKAWYLGVTYGLRHCGCKKCLSDLELFERKYRSLTAKKKPTTKQYRVTRTYFLTLDAEEDVEEFWKKVQDEKEFEEDEFIELLVEI
ncbi:MAG: hypothetical protein ACRDFB_08040 [Rhabdochlamydiaceae bacterium]